MMLAFVVLWVRSQTFCDEITIRTSRGRYYFELITWNSYWGIDVGSLSPPVKDLPAPIAAPDAFNWEVSSARSTVSSLWFLPRCHYLASTGKLNQTTVTRS